MQQVVPLFVSKKMKKKEKKQHCEIRYLDNALQKEQKAFKKKKRKERNEIHRSAGIMAPSCIDGWMM